MPKPASVVYIRCDSDKCKGKDTPHTVVPYGADKEKSTCIKCGRGKVH